MSIPTRNNFLETESFESLMKSLPKSLTGGASSSPTARELFDRAQDNAARGNFRDALENIQQIRRMQNNTPEILEAIDRFELNMTSRLSPEQLRTNSQPLQPALPIPPQKKDDVYNDLLITQLDVLKRHHAKQNGGGFNSLGSSSGGGGEENLTPEQLFESAQVDFRLSNNKDAIAKLNKIKAMPNISQQLINSVIHFESMMLELIPPQYLDQNYTPENPNVNELKQKPDLSDSRKPLLKFVHGNIGSNAQFKPQKVVPESQVENPIVTTSLQLAKEAYVTATSANATAAQKQQAVDAAQRAVNAATEPTNNATQQNIRDASHQWSLAMLANKQEGGSSGNQPLYIEYTYNGNNDFIVCTGKSTLSAIYSYIYNKLNLLPVAIRPVLPTRPPQLYKALTNDNANLTLQNIFGFKLRYNGRDFVEGELRVDAGDMNHVANKKTQLENGDYESLSYIFNWRNNSPLEVVLNPLDDRNNQSAINATFV